MLKNYFVAAYRPASKTQIKTLKKIEDELEAEMWKQISIISGSAGIALYENWGWRTKRIASLFREINECWKECAKDKSISMLGMLEKETGVVIDIPEYEGKYSELLFFQDSSDVELSIQQRIYMRQRQKKWIGAEIFASALLALHRLYGFGGDRLNRIAAQIYEVRDRYNWDAKTIEKACYELTNVGIDIK